MAEKMNGLSLEFIIHPGETVKEVLEERKMSQEELALRTGYSPKHISEVINGKKGISPSFAKCLEYVFGMPAGFWINLQGIYDKEILEYKEQEEIDENEVKIVRELTKLIEYAEELQLMKKNENIISKIIELRNICNVKNLTYINNLVTNQVAFRKSQTIDTNIYVLYVWLRICELNAQRIQLDNDYDVNKLKQNIGNLKKCIFLEVNMAVKELTKILGECGIIFQVVKNFPGAPVQGFIKKVNNIIILSMTIRRSFADEFWFTLFHEIGHLINGDIVNNQLIDYEAAKSDMEDKADEFARNVLINEDDYQRFIQNGKVNRQTIIEFAKKQNVEPFIVVGRIQKEMNDYSFCYDLKKQYKWK